MDLGQLRLNQPTPQVQDEGADYQHVHRSHGCEVPSQDNRHLAIPLWAISGRLLPSPSVSVCPSILLYCNCFLYFYHVLSLQFIVSKWNKNCPYWQCIILFVWPRSRCVAFLHLIVSKNLAFQLYHKKQCPLCHIVRNSITCAFLHHDFNIN